MIVEQGGLGSSGMFHRLLVRSHKTVILTRLCFKIFASKLVKMVMQSSLQSCLKEMREPVVLLLTTWEDFTLEESLFDIFKVALKSGLVILLLAT